jgi:hypothetical protein
MDNHASWLPLPACINTRPLVMNIAAVISLKAIVFHALVQLNWIFDNFSLLSLSSGQAAGIAISWWDMLLSMNNMDSHCFGPMELALPQSWELAFMKNPFGNKGLTLRRRRF